MPKVFVAVECVSVFGVGIRGISFELTREYQKPEKKSIRPPIFRRPDVDTCRANKLISLDMYTLHYIWNRKSNQGLRGKQQGAIYTNCMYQLHWKPCATK